MSDAQFHPRAHWYLPACVASGIALEPDPPGISKSVRATRLVFQYH